jgi:monofunctional biosynthetic peptidoglycan transglycosylase
VLPCPQRHERRLCRPVPLDSISAWVVRAAVAGEDDAFYQHHGIDWRSLRDALDYRRSAFSLGNPRDRAELLRAVGRAGERRDKLRGASTITQQLAKNLYLSPSRNPLRKLKEAVIAYRLEWALGKRRIMELYLNVAEFGPSLWGVAAASESYFGRAAAGLSMNQAALLVATLPHPLTSNPALRPGRTVWRQQLILRRLRGESVVVPQEEAETAVPAATPAIDSVVGPPKDTAAAPAPEPDTAAAKPPAPPPPPF